MKMMMFQLPYQYNCQIEKYIEIKELKKKQSK